MIFYRLHQESLPTCFLGTTPRPARHSGHDLHPHLGRMEKLKQRYLEGKG